MCSYESVRKLHVKDDGTAAPRSGDGSGGKNHSRGKRKKAAARRAKERDLSSDDDSDASDKGGGAAAMTLPLRVSAGMLSDDSDEAFALTAPNQVRAAAHRIVIRRLHGDDTDPWCAQLKLLQGSGWHGVDLEAEAEQLHKENRREKLHSIALRKGRELAKQLDEEAALLESLHD